MIEEKNLRIRRRKNKRRCILFSHIHIHTHTLVTVFFLTVFTSYDQWIEIDWYADPSMNVIGAAIFQNFLLSIYPLKFYCYWKKKRKNNDFLESFVKDKSIVCNVNLLVKSFKRLHERCLTLKKKRKKRRKKKRKKQIEIFLFCNKQETKQIVHSTDYLWVLLIDH